MKRKIILMIILACLSLSSISASAVTYVDSKMSPSANYNCDAQSPSVVFGYNGSNNYAPHVFMPSSNYIDYGLGNASNTLTSTPVSIANANINPLTTNYGKNTGISYELNIGSVYGSANERGDLVSSIRNMPLTKIGIGRTVSELTSLYANSSDDSNYWSFDSNSYDNIIFRCGNYVIIFKSYKTSYGIDVYAEISYAGQNYKLTEAEISNFFAGLSNKLYEKEQKEKAEKVQSTVYNNSIVVNGTNSGRINYNYYN